MIERKPEPWSQSWAKILFNSYVTRNKSLNLSVLGFSISETEIIITTLQGSMRIKGDNICKTLDIVADTEVSSSYLCSLEVL